jgi:hypothetical protein
VVNDRCTRESQFKGFCILYYSIIKDQLLLRRTSLKVAAVLLLEVAKPSKTDVFEGFSTANTMVEVNGIEPMASCVQGRRSPS